MTTKTHKKGTLYLTDFPLLSVWVDFAPLFCYLVGLGATLTTTTTTTIIIITTTITKTVAKPSQKNTNLSRSFFLLSCGGTTRRRFVLSLFSFSCYNRKKITTTVIKKKKKNCSKHKRLKLTKLPPNCSRPKKGPKTAHLPEPLLNNKIGIPEARNTKFC